MKILYFSQFYAPEHIAPAFRATDHSREWAAAGHEVTVFTSWPNYPTGALFDGYEMSRLGQEEIDGVRVFRSASKIQPNTSFRKRFESGVDFIRGGLVNLKKSSPVGADYDVVLVTCGTVFSAWLGVNYAEKHKLPLVVEFRDLTYRQMVATGSLESSVKVRAMKALELSFCRAADRVVVLTKGFREDLVAEGVPADAISVVPNGADIVPCGHAWGDRLRLGYFGTMGLSQDVPTTLDYAGALAGRGLVESYLLIGEGAARPDVESAMNGSSGGFLRLMHGIPMAELETHYASVDMTVVSLRKSDSFKGTIPSKIFQSFARGVPVLFIGPEGDASDLIHESGAGLALGGTREDDLERLEEFASRPDLAQELQRMSEAAVGFMARNYTRKRLAGRMLDILADAARTEGSKQRGRKHSNG